MIYHFVKLYDFKNYNLISCIDLIEYKDVNVLETDELRAGIKEFTDWPTIPQLYVKGEFIGGCDIVLEMHKNGELEEVFKSKNIILS